MSRYVLEAVIGEQLMLPVASINRSSDDAHDGWHLLAGYEPIGGLPTNERQLAAEIKLAARQFDEVLQWNGAGHRIMAIGAYVRRYEVVGSSGQQITKVAHSVGLWVWRSAVSES